jgi:hypothetical protein
MDPRVRIRVVWLTGVLISVALGVGIRSRADDAPKEPAAKGDEQPQRLHTSRLSDYAVVNDVVYHLEVVEDRLVLTSQPLNGENREPKQVTLKFPAPSNGKFIALTLDRLDGKNLMAVVQTKTADEFEYSCITLIAPTGGQVRDGYAYHCVAFHKCREKLRILATNGREYNGSVVIVLGDMDIDERGIVAEGQLFFSGCPWPPYGSIARFKTSASTNVPPEPPR